MSIQKTFFNFIFFFLILLVFSNQAVATGPTKTIETSVNDVINYLKDPSYSNPQTHLQVRNKIENEVRKVFDFSEFSLRTVGLNWNSFTTSQQERFNNAFSDLLLATYLDKIDGYNGEKVTYTNELISSKGDRAEVQTVINLSDGRTIPVVYRMMSKKNTWVVYDVIIENISLIKNYRAQFQDILMKNKPEELIQKVEARAKELHNAASVGNSKLGQ